LVGFLDDVFAWSVDMPISRGKVAGRGLAQTEPPKRTIQVLAELKQLEAFLVDADRVGPAEPRFPWDYD
jgi:hypothetical protein